mmetsp:Transcript_1491/g.1686  ORF Transcript_1491/g.1686 Transcript_1491/m.1686 type:complete len:96 (-) Transcript_1491:117-404(-)
MDRLDLYLFSDKRNAIFVAMATKRTWDVTFVPLYEIFPDAQHGRLYLLQRHPRHLFFPHQQHPRSKPPTAQLSNLIVYCYSTVYFDTLENGQDCF